MVQFSCEDCGKQIRTSDDNCGKRAKCPACGAVIQIPDVPPGELELLDDPLAAMAAAQAATPRADAPRWRPPSSGGFRSAREAARRRRNLTILGAVVLIGFLMPIAVPDMEMTPHGIRFVTKMLYLNIELLSQEGIPGTAVVFLLAPCLAGLAMFVLAWVVRYPGRGIGIILLPIVPILVLLFQAEQRQSVPMSDTVPVDPSSGMLLGVMACLAMFVGARSRWYRPGNGVARGFGMAGGCGYLLYLLLPILPAGAGRLPLIMPFKMLGGPDELLATAIGLILTMLCMIAAAVLCITNGKALPGNTARSRANIAFLLLVVLVPVIGALTILISAGQSIPEGVSVPPAFYAMTITTIIKMVCWFAGMLLLIPVGIIDLIVGDMKRRPQTPPTNSPLSA